MENKFVTYLRTVQFWQLRLKDKNPKDFVFINIKKAKERFMLTDSDINQLVISKEIEESINQTKEGKKIKYYRTLVAGSIDLSLLPKKGITHTELHNQMKKILYHVSLAENSGSTLFFDTFLKYRIYNIDLFFTVDKFSNRVHTPISSFKSELRQNILLHNETTTSLDVVTMQPVLLGKFLKENIGENEYSNWINSGKDIYIMLQQKAKLKNRDEAKKMFFEILFGKPNNQLSELFGNAEWINLINQFKSISLPENPNTIVKVHSNLAWLLQTTEVKLMKKVWASLLKNEIPFLSVHDEIIVRVSDYENAKEIFETVLSNELEYFKINTKNFVGEKSEKCESENKPFFELKNKQIEALKLELIDENDSINKYSKQFNLPIIENEEINEIEKFFSDLSFKESLKLNKYTTVIDLNLFVQSHLEIIKANKNNNAYKPYINRLKELRAINYGELCNLNKLD